MCKFCDFDEDGWADVSKEKKISIGALGQLTLALDFREDGILASIVTDNALISDEINVKAKYCPICGRKLV